MAKRTVKKAAGKPKAARAPRRATVAKPAPKRAKPVVAGPRLLSGGNPQIAKADGDAPVRAYIAAMPGWKRDVGRKLDALAMRVVPSTIKAVRWNTPFYGIEGQGWYMAFHCFDRYIKVSFFRGTSIRPEPPVGSKHPEVRYFHIHEGDWGSTLDEQQLERWISQASELPGADCF